MKKVVPLCVSLALCGSLAGCQGSNVTSPTITPTSTPAAGTVTLKGKIQSTTTGKDFTGYKLYAQAKTTFKIFYASVSSDGTFSVDVAPNGIYILTLVDNKSQVAGVFSPDPSGTDTIVTGIKSGSQNADLGTFTLNEAKGVAAPASALTAMVDSSLIARAANGKPLGFGNLGKGTTAVFTGSLVSGSPDLDQDGLIDSLDADADGDGVVDEIQRSVPVIKTLQTSSGSSSFATTKAGKASVCIKNVGVFMNLKIPYEKTTSFDTTKDMVLTLELVPDSSCVSTIQKIEVLNGPKYLSSTTVVSLGIGVTDNKNPRAYPTAGTLWKNDSYDLHQITPSSDSTRWTIFIVPNDTVVAGDSFHFKVTYTSGPVEHFVKMVDYVFTSIPKMITYNGSTAPTPAAGGSGTAANPLSFSGDLTLAWSRPKDETGAEITGMNYNFSVFYLVGSEQKESKICKTVSDSGGTLTATLSASSCFPATTSAGTTITSYQVNITASSTAGDNSAQIVSFKK